MISESESAPDRSQKREPVASCKFLRSYANLHFLSKALDYFVSPLDSVPRSSQKIDEPNGMLIFGNRIAEMSFRSRKYFRTSDRKDAPGYTLSFSGYPAGISSADDFVLTSAGLVSFDLNSKITARI